MFADNLITCFIIFLIMYLIIYVIIYFINNYDQPIGWIMVNHYPLVIPYTG